MLAALRAAWPELPAELSRFDAVARGGAAAPSFEEYSARLGPALSPFRETCYFDVSAEPSLVAVANERFAALAAALDFSIAPAFLRALEAGAVAGPEVLQIVLGLDAAADRTRLKYYLIFRGPSGAVVETLRRALELPALPASLDPDSVYILGVDFERTRCPSDFKLYVRLPPAGVPRVIRNLRDVEALWRGSRYLVFQHCMLGAGRQVYFHASSAELLEGWLREAGRREPAIASFEGRVEAMNAQLRGAGLGRLRPWIVSLPWAQGALKPGPSNLYFHFEGAPG